MEWSVLVETMAPDGVNVNRGDLVDQIGDLIDALADQRAEGTVTSAAGMSGSPSRPSRARMPLSTPWPTAGPGSSAMRKRSGCRCGRWFAPKPRRPALYVPLYMLNSR